MLGTLKHHRFLFWSFGALYFFGLRALYYYANGQAIANAHLDSHYFAPYFNILVASILAIIFFIWFLIEVQVGALKWFCIPAIIIIFVPIHTHIGSLFYCCPCCCTIRYVHQWSIVIPIIAVTVFSTALLLIWQIRRPTY